MSGYAVTISAVDAATRVIDGVNKRFEALNKRVQAATAPFRRMGEAIGKFTEVTGLDKIATGFKSIASASAESFRGLLRVVEPLAAITGAASLAGMYKLVQAWGDFGTTLANQAARAGQTADQLFTLQNAAKLAGVSAETLTSGMTALNDNLRNAAFGGAPAFLNVLRNLGIGYEDLKKQSPEQQVKTLADALAKVPNATDKALYTKEAFGGEGMIPFLALQSRGIQELIEKAKLLGGSFTPEEVRRAREFASAQDGVEIAARGLGNAIAMTLGPALTPLLTDISGLLVGMREWVKLNQDWLRGEISEKVGAFVKWLKDVDWTAVGAKIEKIALSASGVAKALGGWTGAGDAVLKFFAITWLAGMLAPILQVTTALLAIPVRAALAVGLVNGTLGLLRMPVLAPLALKGDTAVNSQADDAEAARRAGPEAYQAWQNANPNLGSRLGAWWGEHAPVFLGGTPRASGGSSGPVATAPLAPGPRAEAAAAMGEVFQKEFGYTREGSASMIGSGIQESGLNPRAGAGTAHQSMFQWDAERRAAIEAQFHKRVIDMTPAETARAAAWEIDNNPRFANMRLPMRQSHNLPGLNNGVTRYYAAPGNYDTEVPNRLAASQGVLEADRSRTEPTPLPSAANGAGPPGATGVVNMNVRVTGAPAVVTTQSTGDVNVRVGRPALDAQ